jgi:hypothetical protein
MSRANNNNDDDDDTEDLFAAIRRERAPAPPDEYSGELMVAAPFTTAKTRGVDAFIKIYPPVLPTRLVKVRFIEEGPPSVDHIIIRHLDLLLAWREVLGVTDPVSKRDGFEGALRILWARGQGEALLFNIGVKKSNSENFGDENILLGVRRGYPF